ncbi:nuclear transport factor 2 family protein [Pseudomonas sp. CCM 7893]|uniref:Nuclear transport factor 2 family protein n=1 Tax=Pseudomonas spelaei TaxID=1055469 RepID=A0A6I3W8J6_9PSED|nr:nuclear transport factor 2 family protein [Pseudomonas spelaei]MUF03773.1 nuclear transport factor 2 family protein [Pseudomonas spelaei]
MADINSSEAEVILKDYLAALASHSDIEAFIDENVEYVSLNAVPGELKEIMPWAGAHFGFQAFNTVYDWMKDICNYVSFEVDTMFGSGELAAAFGTFSYSAKTIGRVVSTPFALFVKVRQGKIVYFQFYEDTYATASAYRVSGNWNIENASGAKRVGDLIAL